MKSSTTFFISVKKKKKNKKFTKSNEVMNKVNIIRLFYLNLLIKFSHCDKKSCHCERSEAIQSEFVKISNNNVASPCVPLASPLCAIALERKGLKPLVICNIIKIQKKSLPLRASPFCYMTSKLLTII